LAFCQLSSEPYGCVLRGHNDARLKLMAAYVYTAVTLHLNPGISLLCYQSFSGI
jgi:hypothetical protein